jgi:hypothetical protein
MQPLVRRWSRAVVVGILAAACAHPRLATPGFNVSSERSDYSPAVRLAVALPVATPASSSDTLTVVIDSAVITAPGAVSTDTTPVMRDLYITPLLATRASPASATNGPPEPWHAIASGDSVLLADALHLGVPRAVGHLVLRIAPSAPIDPARTWLVFRISGMDITNAVRLADGSIIPRRPIAGGVRVYACADWTLAGYVDKARSKALTKAYTAAC